MSYILGISAFYHDSAATLLKNGEIVASIEEEKFSRKKHDKEFPSESIKYCLSCESISLDDIDIVIFYDKPLTKFERLLETYVSFAPFGWTFYKASLPEWFNGKIFLEKTLRNNFEKIDVNFSSNKKILFSEHHLSHAASAFFPSPFEKSIILCLDGVGEWNTTSAWIGEGNTINKLWSIDFPHSIGLLYSAFTYYLGFEVNNGEYKMMGLSPYGEPKFSSLIEEKIIDIKDDGSFQLDMSYFSFTTDVVMTNEKFSSLFGQPVRSSDEEITKYHMDVAASIQKVTEKIVVLLGRALKKETGLENICLAGGVALNCVANGKLREDDQFKGIWVQPAAGDAGGSLGAALSCWHQYLNNKRIINGKDTMKSSLLGPCFSDKEIEDTLVELGCHYEYNENIEGHVASEITNGNVIGWFQGRAEYGPRALGNRSILADPRNQEMQKKLNLKIKYRESFRPFAPAVLQEEVSRFFSFNGESPYMLFTAKVKNADYKGNDSTTLFDKLSNIQSDIPAVTHVDLSARLQTVSSETNYKFYQLIKSFYKLTSIPLLINTSFNIRGEPIVLTPRDAINCFMNTEMDILVLNNFILYKENQNSSLFNNYSTEELGDRQKQKKSFFKKISEKELKSFGYQFSIILSVVIGLLAPWVWKYPLSPIPFVLALVTLVLRYTYLKGLLVFYYPWNFFVDLMTLVKGKLLLVLSYFIFISPIGIFMKVIGKDPIKKGFLEDQETYFKREEESFDPQSLKFPF